LRKILSIFVLELALLSVAGAQTPNSYTTTFPQAENPISEGGRWINGQTVGLDWKNVRTNTGLAYGDDASGNPNFNDPTAVLSGTWGPNQTATATVYSVNQMSGNVFEEVELRLRTTIQPRVNRGYEINFRCTSDGSQYTEIVRWNGPLGNFTYLSRAGGPGIRNGDTVKATMIGNVITAFINGTQVNQATDNTFTDGSPGIGFYLHNAANVNNTFGFSRFSATDATIPAPPTNLRITPNF